jgi:hypothetical protein
MKTTLGKAVGRRVLLRLGGRTRERVIAWDRDMGEDVLRDRAARAFDVDGSVLDRLALDHGEDWVAFRPYAVWG